MKFTMPAAISSRFARQVLVIEKKSPEILFVGGIALMGATVVSACRATLKLEETLLQAQDDMNAVAHQVETNPDKYSERDLTRLQRYIYIKNAGRVAKLYTPAAILGSLSVAALTQSHNILSKRNAGLSAALVATDRALRDYRSRVRDEYGDDRELELYRGVTSEKRPVLDDEGRETKSSKTVKTGGGRSPYATWFGKDSTFEWSESPEYNLARLSSAQEHANMRLRAKGHLFLNDVFDALGLPRTPAGSQVGWLYNHPDAIDERVDFGVLNGDYDAFLDFVQGHENGIWLDFNVDGEIWRNI